MSEPKVLNAAEVAALRRRNSAQSSRAVTPEEIDALCDTVTALLAWAETVLHETGCAWELSDDCTPDCPGCVQRSSPMRFGPQIWHVAQDRKPCDCVKARMPR